MTAAQFYALTYCELELILKGCADRRKRELRDRREEHAWMIYWLLLPYQKKDADEPLTIDGIMGRKPRTRKPARRFASMEDSAQAWFAASAAQSKQGAKPNG